MKAVVLSGGGSKGSYQIGAWKALRELKINYDIIAGTSVGSINGALMVQNSYKEAVKLWKKINMQMLFGDEVKNPKNMKELAKIYGSNFLKNGGMDVQKLQNLLNETIDEEKFFASFINYGLVTVNLSGRKIVQMKKSKIPRGKLCDYIMASASCYPAFKLKDIDGNKYIDGGMFDNLPINLAIDLGATEIIAIDLSAPGLTKKPKKNIKITKVKPNNKLTNFLDFNENGSKRNMKLGYNDTMKVFKKLNGKKYSFKVKNFDKKIDEYKNIFLYNLTTIIRHNDLIKLINLDKLNLESFLLKTCEQIGLDFKLDETCIYSFKGFNKLLLKKANKLRKQDPNFNKTILLYSKLIEGDYNYIKTKGLLSPKHLLQALYLYTLCEV